MSKYSSEFKLKVINYYNEGHGYSSTAKYFGIPAMSTVQKWIKKCQKGLSPVAKKCQKGPSPMAILTEFF